MKIPPYLFAEMLAFAVGVWRYVKLPNRAFKALVYFLGFIVCVEWYGRIAGRVYGGAIGMVFNISVPIEYMFYVWFLAAQLRNSLYVKLSRVYVFAFAGFALLYNLLSSETEFHGIYIKVGILGVLLFCSLFFSELLRQDQIVNPLAIPVFWICCGLFIFNIGEFLYGFGIAKLAKDPKAWKAIFEALNSNLNVILYTCITVGILMASWRK